MSCIVVWKDASTRACNICMAIQRQAVIAHTHMHNYVHHDLAVFFDEGFPLLVVVGTLSE